MKQWLNQDGSVNVTALAEIEEAVKSVTDKVGGIMDAVAKKGFVPAFVCGHSGLYLPGDYIKEWGRKYGIGLGPHPVSEVYDTDYHTDPPPITPRIRNVDQIMHPAGPSMSQIDHIMLHPTVMSANAAIMHHEDRDVSKRAKILLAKQLANPKSKLATMRALWNQEVAR